MAGARSGLAARREKVFDDAVFQRMKRHHREPPAGLQHFFSGDQRRLQFIQLGVDQDPQRLEGARRRMNLVRLGPDHPRDNVGQSPGRGDRLLGARIDDGAGDAARLPLLAKRIDRIGQIGFAGARHDVGGGRAAVAHPHVERAIEAKREAARGFVELHRGHADIHHDAVERGDALLRADIGQVRKCIFDKRQPPIG